MSNIKSSFQSSSFSYSSSSSSSSDGQATGHRSVQQTYTDPQGNTTTTKASQNLGEPVVQETIHHNSSGRQVVGDSESSTSRRIEDVSDQDQAARDREYEERMEDEYAKREGGA